MSLEESVVAIAHADKEPHQSSGLAVRSPGLSYQKPVRCLYVVMAI